MKQKHLFPWWAGYLLLSPLRRLRANPERFLGNHVLPGMTVIDAGCAMGFFSLPLARAVIPLGAVYSADSS